MSTSLPDSMSREKWRVSPHTGFASVIDVVSFWIFPTFDLEMEMMSRGIRITGNGIHPHDVAQSLDRDNIAVRSGHHCAMPLMNELGVAATSRASFYIYNAREDVEKLFDGIRMTERAYAK